MKKPILVVFSLLAAVLLLFVAGSKDNPSKRINNPSKDNPSKIGRRSNLLPLGNRNWRRNR